MPPKKKQKSEKDEPLFESSDASALGEILLWAGLTGIPIGYGAYKFYKVYSNANAEQRQYLTNNYTPIGVPLFDNLMLARQANNIDDEKIALNNINEFKNKADALIGLERAHEEQGQLLDEFKLKHTEQANALQKAQNEKYDLENRREVDEKFFTERLIQMEQIVEKELRDVNAALKNAEAAENDASRNLLESQKKLNKAEFKHLEEMKYAQDLQDDARKELRLEHKIEMTTLKNRLIQARTDNARLNRAKREAEVNNQIRDDPENEKKYFQEMQDKFDAELKGAENELHDAMVKNNELEDKLKEHAFLEQEVPSLKNELAKSKLLLEQSQNEVNAAKSVLEKLLVENQIDHIEDIKENNSIEYEEKKYISLLNIANLVEGLSDEVRQEGSLINQLERGLEIMNKQHQTNMSESQFAFDELQSANKILSEELRKTQLEQDKVISKLKTKHGEAIEILKHENELAREEIAIIENRRSLLQAQLNLRKTEFLDENKDIKEDIDSLILDQEKSVALFNQQIRDLKYSLETKQLNIAHLEADIERNDLEYQQTIQPMQRQLDEQKQQLDLKTTRIQNQIVNFNEERRQTEEKHQKQINAIQIKNNLKIEEIKSEELNHKKKFLKENQKAKQEIDSLKNQNEFLSEDMKRRDLEREERRRNNLESDDEGAQHNIHYWNQEADENEALIRNIETDNRLQELLNPSDNETSYSGSLEFSESSINEEISYVPDSTTEEEEEPNVISLMHDAAGNEYFLHNGFYFDYDDDGNIVHIEDPWVTFNKNH